VVTDRLPIWGAVERASAWLERYRRLGKDNEACTLSSDACHGLQYPAE
jgi:hypothetical protein